MTAGNNRMVSEDLRSCIIRVERYDNKNPEGTFYNLYYGMELPFENLTRLLLMMEDLMDELDCPQAALKSKRFDTAAKQRERDSLVPCRIPPSQEALGTFKVQVLFRQGASWQGRIHWLEADLETTFRSALELVKLMDSALPQPQSCSLLDPEDLDVEVI